MTIIYAWDPQLLENLDVSQFGLKFEDGFSPTNPFEGIKIRPLSRDDYDKGFPHILSQLTSVGSVNEEAFHKRFDGIKLSGGYYTLVVEDLLADNGNGKIVGTATLEVEQKYIHSCALRGRIEEVVVDTTYRGRKFGKLLLGLLTVLSKKLNCYKITLECKEENIPFYGIFGYKPASDQYMQLRFWD